MVNSKIAGVLVAALNDASCCPGSKNRLKMAQDCAFIYICYISLSQVARF